MSLAGEVSREGNGVSSLLVALSGTGEPSRLGLAREGVPPRNSSTLGTRAGELLAAGEAGLDGESLLPNTMMLHRAY